MEILILKITITEWLDASSREGSKLIPTRMTLNADIDGLLIENILLPYIPVDDHIQIRKKIREALFLGYGKK